MPQMEFADYAPQLAWLAITFAILYFLMARVALPRITDVLEAREQRIANDLERAELLRRDAEAAEQEYERAAAETRSRAQEIASEAREKLKAEQNQKMASLEADLAKQMADSTAEIARARQQAMDGLRGLAADLAQAAAGRLLGSEVALADAGKAVDAELAAKD
jgi:F-type H+-transporting ATPase subunit b